MLAKRATTYLSEKLHTKVHIQHVKFSFFNNFNLQGVYIEDDKKDTLAYIGNIQLKTSELLSNYWHDTPFIIHDMGIENAYVYLNRAKDTTRWNYDFIADAFASKNKDTTSIPEPSSTKTKSNDPQFDLKNVALKNVTFFYDDAWRGEDMRFQFQQLHLNIDAVDLKNKKIGIENLAIAKVIIEIKEYKGGKPKDLTPDDTTEWGTPFNPDLFNLHAKKISISESEFNYIADKDKPKINEFDEKHIGITNLNIDLENTQIIADTLLTDIKKLTAKERCGLEIKELTAQAKISQVQSYLSNMLLKTNHSTIRDYYEMKYKNFHSFNDYINKVEMIAQLKNTSVSSIDVAYFANILNQYPIAIQLAGNIKGTVADINATNLSLATLHTSFKGNAHVTGLPNIKNTIFDVDAKELLTSGNDLNKLIPQTKVDAVAWNDLQKIQFAGSYKGKVDAFTTKGNLNTSLGNTVVDLYMNFQQKNPAYKGKIETNNLQLGKLIKQNNTLGMVSINGTIDGEGFDLNSLKAKVKATVNRIDVEGTTYNNIVVDGLVANKKFDGIFVSQDEKLALNFNGKLDLSGKQANYQFSSRFIKINLQKMGVTQEPIIASGYATLHFTGDNIDNFFGTADFVNVHIQNKQKEVHFDKLKLNSFTEDNNKIIQLESSIADATLKGKYNISELAPAFQLYLYHYLPEYIKRPTHFKDQNFTFNATIKNANDILNTFIPNLTGISGTTIEGELNTFNQKLSLDVNVPSVGWDNLIIKDIALVGGGDFNSLDVNATTQNLLYNSEVVIPSMQVNTSMSHDTASLVINTQSINDLLGDASLNCKATAFNNNLFVHLLPSNMSIKNDKWQFYSERDIVIGNLIDIQNLIIENGSQRIAFNSENTSENNVRMDISNIDLESISEYASIEPKYIGRIEGTVNINNFTKEPIIVANILSKDEIMIGKDTLGKIKLMAQYDVANNTVNINPSTNIERNGNFATISGMVNAKDSTIKLAANLDKQSISFINQFLSDYIQNLKGLATGKVKIEGRLTDPTITGNVVLDDASLKIIFLGTTYTINQASLNFNNHKIEMDDFYLKDERNGDYKGKVKGYISHNNFADFFFNLKINSDNLLCLNTKEYDNDIFYGYVPAKVNVDVTGALEDIEVDMDVKPLKGSKFFMPLNSKGDASTYDYVHYKQIGHFANENENKKKSSSYVKLNMTIDATPNAETYIILDQNTQEQIIAQGYGKINLGIDLGNSIDMNGTYNITEGKYLFNFRGTLNKEFNIDEGSKITWNGDALDAVMDIKAVYQLPKNKSLYPLVMDKLKENGSEDEKAEAKKEYPTFVSIYLKNSLMQPDISFDISQPENKAIGSIAYNELERIKKDEKDLFAQAGILLLFNEFRTSNTASNNTSYSQGAITTVSDMVTSYVSSELTNQFQNLTGLKNINFTINYQNANQYLDETTNKGQIVGNINANFFKERLMVDVTNNFDLGTENSANKTGTNTTNWGGNFKAQYLITEDGRFRANTYARYTPDVTGNNFTNAGAGLSYRKTFNKFSELFSAKKRKSKKQEGGS